MNATVPRLRGRRAGELGAEAFRVPPSGAREGSRMKREPYAGLVNCWGGGSDLRNPRPRMLGVPPWGPQVLPA